MKQTKEKAMSLNTVKQINQLVDELINDEETQPIVDTLKDALTNYKTILATRERVSQLKTINKIIDNIKIRYPELKVDVSELNDIRTIVFNDTYGIRLTHQTHIGDLVEFANFVINQYELKPSTKTSTVPDTESIQPVASQQSDITDPHVPTESEIAAKKKDNVEHIKKLKESQERETALAREKVLRDRCVEIDTILKRVTPDVEETLETIDLVAQASPELDHDVRLEEIIKISKQSAVLVRLLVQVYIINSQLIQDGKEWNTRSNKPKEPVTLNTEYKKQLFMIAVTQLKLVKAHSNVRGYPIQELIVTMLDYCDKTSSLIIIDTPEDIASLASGIYDILLNKDLNRDFVYKPDNSNPLLENDANWYKNSKVLRSYVVHIPFTSAIEYMDEPVKKLIEILHIVGQRDVLFANQTLSHSGIKRVFEIASDVINNSDTEQNYYSFKYKKNDILELVILSKLPNGTIVCIVRDEHGVSSYIQYNDNKSYQQHHTNDTVNVLIKWFENIIPNHV